MKVQNVHFNVEPELSARLSGYVLVCLIYGSSIAVRSLTWHRLKSSPFPEAARNRRKLFLLWRNFFAVRAYEIPTSIIERGFLFGEKNVRKESCKKRGKFTSWFTAVSLRSNSAAY